MKYKHIQINKNILTNTNVGKNGKLTEAWFIKTDYDIWA